VRGIYTSDPAEDRAGASAEGPAGDGAASADPAGDGASANDEIPQQLTDALAAGENGHEKPRTGTAG
jgi:hypothetical protein